MLVINYEEIHEAYGSIDKIYCALVESGENFVFQMKIERARHYSDLAHNYLEASYIGEELCKFCTRVSFDIDWASSYHPQARFTLKIIDAKSLSEVLHFLGNAYIGNDEELQFEFMESKLIYQDELETRIHKFPELVDDYFANYINGQYHENEEDEDFFQDEFSNYPERKFGFWKASHSKNNETFYVSNHSWIIPRESDVNTILKEHAGIDTINFKSADLLVINEIPLLISDAFIVRFPFENFAKCKQCSSLALSQIDLLSEKDWPSYLLDFQPITNSVDSKGIYLSEYADHILVVDSGFCYLFFNTIKLDHNELLGLSEKLSSIFHISANLAGIHVEIKCPWEQLDDDSFEEICYDILYHNPKFDNSTIRKMGKSRSRDGGRDIVIYTKTRYGHDSQKFIFQCKYQKKGSSLAGSKVNNISDTILQFEASGYGVMTNVVIDSTLYDKLDAIGNRLTVEIEDYSVYKLERILSYYPQLKKRHFTL